MPINPYSSNCQVARYFDSNRNTYYSKFAYNTLDTLAELVENETEKMNKLLGEARFTIDMPLISIYIVEQTGFVGDLIETALEIRATKEARAFRKLCTDFDLAARIGETTTLYKMKNEIESAAFKIKDKYKGEDFELAVEFPLSLSLPALSIGLTQIWDKLKMYRKNQLIFLDKVYEAAIKSEGIRKAFYRKF